MIKMTQNHNLLFPGLKITSHALTLDSNFPTSFRSISNAISLLFSLSWLGRREHQHTMSMPMSLVNNEVNGKVTFCRHSWRKKAIFGEPACVIGGRFPLTQTPQLQHEVQLHASYLLKITCVSYLFSQNNITMKISALSLLALVGSSAAFVSNTPAVRWRSETSLFERRPFITGNWKLNPTTRDEAVELAKGIADAVKDDSEADVALFVPFPFLEAAQQAAGRQGDDWRRGKSLCMMVSITGVSTESFFS